MVGLLRRHAQPDRRGCSSACGPTPCPARRPSGSARPAGEVRLVDFDPDGEDKLLAAICFAQSTLSEDEALRRVRALSADERISLLHAYVGDRKNRRHRPGRAFERTDYRFEIVVDYGAFRDLQRHRLLTIEWQPLDPELGYTIPDLVVEAGEERRLRRVARALPGPLRRHGATTSRWRPATRSRWPTGCAASCR